MTQKVRVEKSSRVLVSTFAHHGDTWSGGGIESEGGVGVSVGVGVGVGAGVGGG